MTRYKLIAIILAVLVVAGELWLSVMPAFAVQVDPGTNNPITIGGTCRKVNNPGGYPAIFIPDNGACDGASWCGFVSGKPGHITFSACISCGDGSCNGSETCSSCSGDCGLCPCTTAAGTYSHGASPTLYYYWDTYCSLGQNSSTCGTYSQTKTCSNGSWSGGDFSAGYTATSCTYNNCADCWHPNAGWRPHGETRTSYYYWNTYCSLGHDSGTCGANTLTKTCDNGNWSGGNDWGGYTATSCTHNNDCASCSTAAGTWGHGANVTLYYYWDTYCTSGHNSGTCGTYSQNKTCSNGSWSGGDFSYGYTATSCAWNNNCTYCGDGTCNGGETQCDCPGDCGACGPCGCYIDNGNWTCCPAVTDCANACQNT